MKRILTFCLLLLATGTTWAYDFVLDGIYYNIVSRDDLTCEVTYRSAADGYNTYSGSVVIPEIANYYGMLFTVVGIGESAFRKSDSLTEVEIPSSVTYIGEYAFYYCTALGEVEVPEAVTSMGTYAFGWCTSLRKANIPYGVTTLPYGIFYECVLLSEITIPETVTTTENYPFAFTALKSVTIPASMKTIGGWAFYNCKSLKEVTFAGENLTEINAYTFAYCDSLDNVVVPNSVTIIWQNAFRSCLTMKKITIGSSVTSIQYRTFYDTTTLEEIYVLNPTPPEIAEDTFSNKMDKDQCTLYVPYGCANAYATAEYWEEFYNIEELEGEDPSGISSIGTNDTSIVGYYTLGGVRLSAPQKGVNIVKCSDGTTKKILIK